MHRAVPAVAGLTEHKQAYHEMLYKSRPQGFLSPPYGTRMLGTPTFSESVINTFAGHLEA